MKLETNNPVNNKSDLGNMLSDVQDILNLGLYQITTTSTVPSDTPTEGEQRFYYSGTDRRLYTYANGVWSYTSSSSTVEQSGFGYLAEAASPSVSGTVTFSSAFASSPKVFVSYIGSRLISAGTPTDPSWFTGALTLRYAIGYATTTSGFTATIENSTGNNLDATYYSGFVWRALL